MEDEQTFKTTDIVLASTLKLKGNIIENIEIAGNKGTFIFSNVSSDFIKDFDLGKILVEPTEFNNTIKQLTTSVRRLIRN